MFNIIRWRILWVKAIELHFVNKLNWFVILHKKLMESFDPFKKI